MYTDLDFEIQHQAKVLTWLFKMKDKRPVVYFVSYMRNKNEVDRLDKGLGQSEEGLVTVCLLTVIITIIPVILLTRSAYMAQFSSNKTAVDLTRQ